MDDPTHHEPAASPLQQELEAARAEAASNLDGWKRAKADYLNLKRDAERERVELAKFANLAFIIDLLPVLDNFSRAMQHLPPPAAQTEWVQGVQSIRKQLQDALSGMGVQEVGAEGTFNPELHEAVATEAHEGIASGTVIEVIQSGYTLHGRLIRPAKVKAAK